LGVAALTPSFRDLSEMPPEARQASEDEPFGPSRSSAPGVKDCKGEIAVAAVCRPGQSSDAPIER
jgi:hypothetical protein